MFPTRGSGRVASPLLIVVLAITGLAGCLQADQASDVASPESAAVAKVKNLPVSDQDIHLSDLVFDPPVLLDKIRPGGEPVIAVTPKGTILVSAHPGYTHLFLGSGQPKVDPSWPQSLSGENMLWRSTDGGKTWAYVGIPIANAGKRNTDLSVSDPDIAIDSEGTIFLVSLHFASVGVSRSSDDGATWVGNPVAMTEPFPANDRPWVEAYKPDQVWIVTGNSLWKSIDGAMGLQYMPQSTIPSTGSERNLKVDPRDGTLYAGSATGGAYSTDAGATWKKFNGGPKPDQAGILNLGQLAVDKAGNVYGSYFRHNALYYAAWTAHGEKYLGEHQVTNLSGTHLWPWIVAGDTGRIAIAWLGSDNAAGPGAAGANWFAYAAVVEDANTDAPIIHANKATEKPIHRGAMCQSGVACVGRGDRRLGDFITAEIDLEGYFLIASAATQTGDAGSTDGMISHPVVVKQSGGPLLRVPAKA